MVFPFALQIYLFLSFSAHNTIFFRIMLPKKTSRKEYFFISGGKITGKCPERDSNPHSR